MKPIQGPSQQSIAFPKLDGSDKNAAHIQAPASTEQPQQADTSKSYSSQIPEAKLQGNLRAMELNSAYQHNQSDFDFIRSRNPGSENNLEPSKIEYPNLVFAKDPKSVKDSNDE